MNQYQYTFAARCPANGEVQIYSLHLSSNKTIMVEDIKAACAKWLFGGYHEDIADDLHARFGGHQILRAMHHGVDITTARAEQVQA